MKEDQLQMRWHTNGEIYMPAVRGVGIMLAMVVLERWLNLPVIVGLTGGAIGVVATAFSAYRFLAKTSKPLPN